MQNRSALVPAALAALAALPAAPAWRFQAHAASLPARATPGDPTIHPLLLPGRTWTRADLAGLLHRCRKAGPRSAHRQAALLARLLSEGRPLRTDASLTAGITVGEVALACLDELTGESFCVAGGGTAPIREILSTTRRGQLERFYIPVIAPGRLPEIQKAVQAWLDRQAP